MAIDYFWMEGNYGLSLNVAWIVSGCFSICRGLAAASKSILKPKRRRKVWVKEWLRKREDSGAYHAIMNELKLTDQFAYRRYIRMDVHVFEVIEL